MQQFRRRDFIRTGTAALGAAALGLSGARKAVAANEKIAMGIIGVGGMGNGHISWFGGMPDVEVVAVCDVDQGHRDAAVQRLTDMRPEVKVQGYQDFREVLARDDIQAVSYATPDHWHAPIAMAAFEAGKDAYGEKPLSRTLREADAMAALRRRQDRVFQLGTQIHEGENYHRTVEIVRSGALGKIHTVRVWKNGGVPQLDFVPDQDPPPGLDWEMWLGPAPWRRYNPNRCFFNFRHFWDYSGGTYADFWCHISDIVFWALEDLGAPKTIVARGEVPTGTMAETPAWIDVDYEFDDLTYHWTTDTPDVPGAAGRGIGACFEGTSGSLVVDYGSRVIFLDDKEMDDIPDVPRDLPRSPGHQRNFIDCVRSRQQPESNLDYVRRMTTPMYLGLISFRLGRKLTWDEKKRGFVDDIAANSLLSPGYRAPWVLPA